MAHPQQTLLGRLISDAIFAGGAALALTGIGVVGFQSWVWFGGAAWPELSFGAFWLRHGGPYPMTDWSGLSGLFLWLFRQPLSLTALALGVVLLSAGQRPAPPQRTIKTARGPGARGNRAAGW